MSSFSSVLSSINAGKPPPSRAPAPALKKEPPSAETRDATSSAKRKASSELPRPTDKLPKSASVTTGQGSATAFRPSLSKPSSAAKPIAAQRPAKPDAAKPSSDIPKGPPKKGTYAEILARAKQNSSLQVGQLKHQPKENVSTKKALMRQREEAKLAKTGKSGLSRRDPPPSKDVLKNGTSLPGKGAVDSKDPRKAPAAGTGYKGTAKPRPQPTYQGTAKPSRPQPTYKGTVASRNELPAKRGYDSEPDRARPKAVQGRRGRSYDSDDEDNESEDRYNYDSEDYSDMDAGFDDVDEEEEMAAREAKKEDIREQKLLEQKAREKEERKRKALGR